MHPRQSTAPDAGQRGALLPILGTDALARAQRDRDRQVRPMGFDVMTARERPWARGEPGRLLKVGSGRTKRGLIRGRTLGDARRIAIAQRPRDVAGWSMVRRSHCLPTGAPPTGLRERQAASLRGSRPRAAV